jgi:hypothetical protein
MQEQKLLTAKCAKKGREERKEEQRPSEFPSRTLRLLLADFAVKGLARGQ